MAKRKGDAVHGWIALDKPLGLSSSQAVGRVRRAFNAAKAGHGGTLDPLASGILPICLGEATKTSAFAMDHRKTYRFTVKWGEATTTLDAEGDVTETSNIRPEPSEIKDVLPIFEGEIDQIPPVYSALKVNGERAYAKARRDEAVELAPRRVFIDSLTLVGTDGPDSATFVCTCGKGTYVRALARDIAAALGTVGHVTALRRTAVGPLTEKNAITLDKLDALGHSPARFEALLPVETVLDDIPALAVTEEEGHRLSHGQSLLAFDVARRTPLPDLTHRNLVQVHCGGTLLAVAGIRDGRIKPERVFNL